MKRVPVIFRTWSAAPDCSARSTPARKYRTASLGLRRRRGRIADARAHELHHETCQQDPGQGGIAIGGRRTTIGIESGEENRPDGDRRPGLRTDWTERSGPEEEDQGDEGNADDGVERVRSPWRAAAMKIGRGVSHSVLLGGAAHEVGRVASRIYPTVLGATRPLRPREAA